MAEQKTDYTDEIPLPTPEIALQPLTDMQRAFARSFAETGNATQSAVAAGYSPRTAGQMAMKLKRIPKIATAVAALQRERHAKAELSDELIIKNLIAEALERGTGSSANARVQANKLLAEIQGTFTRNKFDALKHVRRIRLELALPKVSLLKQLVEAGIFTEEQLLDRIAGPALLLEKKKR